MILVVVQPMLHHFGELLDRPEHGRGCLVSGKILVVRVGLRVRGIVMVRMLARVPMIFVMMPLLTSHWELLEKVMW
jgi:hypothetical protein